MKRLSLALAVAGSLALAAPALAATDHRRLALAGVSSSAANGADSVSARPSQAGHYLLVADYYHAYDSGYEGVATFTPAIPAAAPVAPPPAVTPPADKPADEPAKAKKKKAKSCKAKAKRIKSKKKRAKALKRCRKAKKRR